MFGVAMRFLKNTEETLRVFQSLYKYSLCLFLSDNQTKYIGFKIKMAINICSSLVFGVVLCICVIIGVAVSIH